MHLGHEPVGGSDRGSRGGPDIGSGEPHGSLDPHGCLDPVIHPLPRLRICAMLSGATEMEFATLERELGLSASALSKQLARLASAGYVAQRRRVDRSHSRVWLRLTRAGRAAYRSHRAALTALVEH
jgi:DNA-binding MarR family transcriptional regulator